MNQNNEASDDDIGIEGDLLESRDDAPTRTESAFVSENCCPTDEEASADEDDNEDGTGTLPLKAIKSRFFLGRQAVVRAFQRPAARKIQLIGAISRAALLL